jgi:outer membrane protein assembly factor BamB
MNPSTNRFCTECGAALPAAKSDHALRPAAQTQFTLPDYLIAAREREANERRRHGLDDGSGSGYIWIGALLAAGAALLSSLSGVGAWLFAFGALLVLFGLWRLRTDRHTFARAGLGLTIVSAVTLGAVLGQVVNLPVLPRSAAPARPTPSPTPDPLEQAAASPTAIARIDVPMFRADAARTGVEAGPGPKGSPMRAWRVFTGGELYSSPVIAGGTVYVGAKDGYLLALDAATGQEKWRFDLGGYIVRGTPAVSQGIVFAQAGYSLFAIDARSGNELWRIPIRFAGPSSPVVSGRVVYVATQEGQLYAVEAATGREEWHYSTEGLIYCPPAVALGTLFVGDDTGKIYALDAANGHERWRATIGGDLYAAPVVGLGAVFVSSTTPSLVALDANSGQIRWQAPLGGDSSPALAGATLVFGSKDNGVYAVDVANGKPKWLFPTGAGIASSPVVAGGVVYVGSGTTLYALDAATGVAKWGYPTGGAVTGSAAIAGGVAYFGSQDGFLYAVKGSAG